MGGQSEQSGQSGHGRRSTRDWLVDFTFFLAAAVYGVVVSGFALEDPESLPHPRLFAMDQLLGVAACAALWWRRGRPVHIGVLLVLASAFSETAAGAMVVGIFTVAVHRGVRAGVVVCALSVVSAAVFLGWRPEVVEDRGLVFAVGCAIHLAAAGWGIAVHHRRSLLRTLSERADQAEAQAEAQAELRADQARRENRDEIAREIHDVLGHRLSLLSVHAGALEYRRDAAPEEIRQAAGVMRQHAHEALQDLRDVVGVLRAPALDVPQPVLNDLAGLVEESRRAGSPVTFTTQLASAPPELHQRTVYRIVQEGLTNARKYAPGAAVTVRVEGDPEAGLTVCVTDRGDARRGDFSVTGGRPGGLAAQAAGGEPAAVAGGQGLAGLGERAQYLGGSIDHGPEVGGGWTVRAWIPWRR